MCCVVFLVIPPATIILLRARLCKTSCLYSRMFNLSALDLNVTHPWIEQWYFWHFPREKPGAYNCFAHLCLRFLTNCDFNNLLRLIVEKLKDIAHFLRCAFSRFSLGSKYTTWLCVKLQTRLFPICTMSDCGLLTTPPVILRNSSLAKLRVKINPKNVHPWDHPSIQFAYTCHLRTRTKNFHSWYLRLTVRTKEKPILAILLFFLTC